MQSQIQRRLPSKVRLQGFKNLYFSKCKMFQRVLLRLGTPSEQLYYDDSRAECIKKVNLLNK